MRRLTYAWLRNKQDKEPAVLSEGSLLSVSDQGKNGGDAVMRRL